MADTAFKVKNGLVVNGSLLVANTDTNRVGIGTTSPAYTLDLGAATDGMYLPRGNTAQRGTTSNGAIRFNTETGQIEGVTSNAWGSIGGVVTVGGANTQMVFNDSGLLGATAGVTFNKTTNTVSIANSVAIGTTTVNSTAMTIGGVFATSPGTTLIQGANVVANTTAITTSNGTAWCVMSSNGTLVFNGGTINATSYTGTAAAATNATNANNSTYHQGYTAAQLLAFGNFTGTISQTQLGTGNHVQFASIGVGLAPQGSSRVDAAGVIYSYTQLQTAGNVYSNSSDRRLKTNVTAIQNALEKVGKLHGIQYILNDLARELGHKDFEPQVGLFADEVEAVLPEAVGLSAVDRDVEGNSITGENYKTIMYERIVPLLVEAIKELTARVEELEAR